MFILLCVRRVGVLADWPPAVLTYYLVGMS